MMKDAAGHIYLRLSLWWLGLFEALVFYRESLMRNPMTYWNGEASTLNPLVMLELGGVDVEPPCYIGAGRRRR